MIGMSGERRKGALLPLRLALAAAALLGFADFPRADPVPAAGGGIADALSSTGHSRGAILDQVEALARPTPDASTGVGERSRVITGQREITGVGDRRLLIDAPFTVVWESSGRQFSLSARRVDDSPLDRPAPGRDGARISSATVVTLMQAVRTATSGDFEASGKGRGRLRQATPGRYEIRIESHGPWVLRVSGAEPRSGLPAPDVGRAVAESPATRGGPGAAADSGARGATIETRRLGPPSAARIAAPSSPPSTGIAGGDRPYLQIGVFGVPANAAAIVRRFRGQGIPVRGIAFTRGARTFSRVVAGPFADRAERDRAIRLAREVGVADATPVRR